MNRKHFLLALILFTFFVISFLTNIIGPLVPEILADFRLSLFLAGFLPFSFFVAYAVFSVPSGILMERWGAKKVMLLAFVVAFSGALLFALSPNYRMAVISLFVIGSGMAMLQVILYPLLRTTGGQENFAFNSVMAQLAFGLASFLSPLVYSRLVRDLQAQETDSLISRLLSGLVPDGLEWISMYWIFALISMLMLILIGLSSFPRLELTDEERIGDQKAFAELLRKPLVWLYFFAIFFYVGLEQGVNNWASQFLYQYHGLNPQTEGATVVSRYWGLMTIGTLLGLPVLRLVNSKKVLIGASLAAMFALTAALFGNSSTAQMAFPLIGFFASVMFAIIIDLGLNSVREHHGAFAGIMLSGIVGGALWPLLIGGLGDVIGLKNSLLLLYVALVYVLSAGLWARPLISNKTVNLFKKNQEHPR